MSKYEIGKKIAELEIRISALENQESSDQEKAIGVEEFFLVDDNENILSEKDQKNIIEKLGSNQPIIVVDGTLRWGNTGFPDWRTYNYYSGKVKLQTIDRKDIKCEFIVTSSKKGKSHKYPNQGSWEMREENTIWGPFGVTRGRTSGPHTEFATWAKFKTEGYGIWVWSWYYG